ncbi:hypothetical protein HA402_008856 [Bradysia odoriphaga]|nr:hypothetical protein HA402_008856 [Bradysia odoriphaga]
MATTSFHNQGPAVNAEVIYGNVNANTTIYNNAAEPDPIRDGIEFRIAKPEINFTGRSTELDQLMNISSSKNAETVVVSGMGGVGKTQLARKFIEKNRKDYGHVIWIDSQTEATINESFKKLSEDELHIQTFNASGKEKDSKSIIEQAMKKLCRTRTLFIYDNVEQSAEIIKFILAIMPLVTEKPHILITSRLRDWYEGILVIRLKVWNQAQSLEYISGMLMNSRNDSESDKKRLAETLQHFPLALRQTTAFINHQRKRHGTFTISQFINKYTRNTAKLLNSKIFQRDTIASYEKTTCTTWDITIDAIRENDEHGDLAIRILNIAAYFDVNSIGRENFLYLARDKSQLSDGEFKECVMSAVDLLLKYNMIDIRDNQRSFDIHRLVQAIIRFKLTESNEEMLVLKDGIDMIENSFKGESLPAFEIYFHAVSLLVHASPNFSQLLAKGTMPTETLAKLAEWADLDKIEILEKRILGPLTQALGENDRDLLRIRFNVAENFLSRKVNEQALHRYLDIHNSLQIDFGEADDDTLRTHFEIARLYRHLGNSEAALEWYEKLFEIKQKTLDENDDSILGTMSDLGKVYSSLAQHSKALKLYEEIYERRKIKFGENDDSAVQIKCEMAIQYSKLGQHAKAIKLYEEVYERRKTKFGENNGAALQAKCEIASEYSKLGQHSEAIKVYDEVYERRKIKFGENDEETLQTKSEIASEYSKLGQYSEALRFLQNVYKTQKESFGEYHLHSVRTKGAIEKLKKAML